MKKLIVLSAVALFVAGCTPAQLDRFDAVTSTIVGDTLATCDLRKDEKNSILIELGTEIVDNENVNDTIAEFNEVCDRLQAAVEAGEK